MANAFSTAASAAIVHSLYSLFRWFSVETEADRLMAAARMTRLTPIRIMQEKLNSLQIMLAQARMEVELLRYEFFEANLLPELKDVGLFDFPLFLHHATAGPDPLITVIVFDIKEEIYRLIRCRSLWNSNLPNLNGMYSSELLKQDQVVFSGSAEEMVSAFAEESRRSINIW